VLSKNLDTTICQGEILKLGSFSFTMPGDFDVYVSTPGQCDTLVKLKLQVIQVNSQIDRIGDKLAVISLENAQYQWFSCSGGDTVALTGQISFEFSPPENGNYLVKIYFGNCEFVSDCFNFV